MFFIIIPNSFMLWIISPLTNSGSLSSFSSKLDFLVLIFLSFFGWLISFLFGAFLNLIVSFCLNCVSCFWLLILISCSCSISSFCCNWSPNFSNWAILALSSFKSLNWAFSELNSDNFSFNGDNCSICIRSSLASAAFSLYISISLSCCL